jgi:N-acetylglucosamine malate deacetylase 1
MANVLVIAAHPDDEVLGCGATIALHAQAGDIVHVAIMAQGLASRGSHEPAEFAELRRKAQDANRMLGVVNVSFADFPDNAMDTVARLDVVKKVEELIASVRPSVIYTHFPYDLNVDHRRVAESVITACRPQPSCSVERVLYFEVPSSTEWTFGIDARTFSPNWFVDISATLAVKVRALRAYDSEMRPWPHARSFEAVEHLAHWRGASVGVIAAEAFVLARAVLR